MATSAMRNRWYFFRHRSEGDFGLNTSSLVNADHVDGEIILPLVLDFSFSSGLRYGHSEERKKAKKGNSKRSEKCTESRDRV